MNNEISLQQAIDMTTRFREQNASGGKMVIPNCETFDRAVFDQILGQTGCVKMRIYSGLDTDFGYRAIIVGVNDKDEDILPPSTTLSTVTDGNGTIGEDGMTCPPYCPPSSPLNP
jgi:hypothetical protein